MPASERAPAEKTSMNKNHCLGLALGCTSALIAVLIIVILAVFVMPGIVDGVFSDIATGLQ